MASNCICVFKSRFLSVSSLKKENKNRYIEIDILLIKIVGLSWIINCDSIRIMNENLDSCKVELIIIMKRVTDLTLLDFFVILPR